MLLLAHATFTHLPRSLGDIANSLIMLSLHNQLLQSKSSATIFMCQPSYKNNVGTLYRTV